MRVVVQVAKNAVLTVNDKIESSIAFGMFLLVGFTHGDNEDTVKKMAEKVINLRIFDDHEGKTNLDIKAVNGEILCVSQFTLYATLESRRPGFTDALAKDESKKLYTLFNNELAKQVSIATGIFGADMSINFTNVGPATYIIEL